MGPNKKKSGMVLKMAMAVGRWENLKFKMKENFCLFLFLFPLAQLHSVLMATRRAEFFRNILNEGRRNANRQLPVFLHKQNGANFRGKPENYIREQVGGNKTVA